MSNRLNRYLVDTGLKDGDILEKTTKTDGTLDTWVGVMGGDGMDKLEFLGVDEKDVLVD